MDRAKLGELYKKYSLDPEKDIYKHKHYTIITRQGIDKIQGVEQIIINYEVIRAEPEYWAVKAKAQKGKDGPYIETFGSALHGDYKSGNTTTWYVAEMAEKRAMSRAVLKLTGFYELGVFGEDESEDFKRNYKSAKQLAKA